MRPAPVGNRSFMPFPPRGTPAPPDLFALYAAANGIPLDEAIVHIARLAGLMLDEIKPTSRRFDSDPDPGPASP